jgi:hypothetical protein
MPTETGRHRLYEKIKEQWGEEHAAELMSYLPPVGWADVATKHDLAQLSNELRGEMSQLRGEMTELRNELRGEMSELRAEMHQELGHQLRWILGSTMTAMVVLTGLFAIIVGLLA